MLRLLWSFVVYVFLGLLWAAPAWAPAWLMLSAVVMGLGALIWLLAP